MRLWYVEFVTLRLVTLIQKLMWLKNIIPNCILMELMKEKATCCDQQVTVNRWFMLSNFGSESIFHFSDDAQYQISPNMVTFFHVKRCA
jgi:hypothetical protein